MSQYFNVEGNRLGTLTVRHMIPIEDKHGSQANVTFLRWLPESESDVIIRQEDHRIGRLWMDISCLGFLSKPWGPISLDFLHFA